MYKLSRAHGMYSILLAFFQRIQRVSGNRDKYPSLVLVLTRLFQLFALKHIENDLADFVASGWFESAREAGRLVKQGIKDLLAQLRPDAVPLVDSFDLSDYELNSALGRHDGNYIETLYQWAQLDPLNTQQAELGGAAIDGYQEYLRPLLRANL
jgi:acyl-CoA oxidase